MGYPITLAVTTGRSGSTFLADSFQLSAPGRGCFYHERLHPAISRPADLLWRTDLEDFRVVLANRDVQILLEDFDARSEKGPVVDFGFTLTGLIPAFAQRYGSRLRVLVLHRHPVAVAASFAIRGHYTRYRNPAWAISPLHTNARFRHYESRWPGFSRFEKCLYRWLEITAFGVQLPARMPGVACMSIESSHLFSDDRALQEIAGFIGLEDATIKPSTRKNASEQHYIERWPLGPEWQRFFDMPDVVELAEQLGYDCSRDAVARIASAYRLPGGVGALLRHRSRYWAWRERLGAVRDHLKDKSRTDRAFRPGPST